MHFQQRQNLSTVNVMERRKYVLWFIDSNKFQQMYEMRVVSSGYSEDALVAFVLSLESRVHILLGRTPLRLSPFHPLSCILQPRRPRLPAA
eukprot:scaffold561541_cov28-Prasinocladus_malaysianus.AAC.1